MREYTGLDMEIVSSYSGLVVAWRVFSLLSFSLLLPANRRNCGDRAPTKWLKDANGNLHLLAKLNGNELIPFGCTLMKAMGSCSILFTRVHTSYMKYEWKKPTLTTMGQNVIAGEFITNELAIQMMACVPPRPTGLHLCAL